MADFSELLGANGGEDDERIKNLEAQVAQLISRQQSGNVFGGIIHANIGPGAYTHGPYRMDVDSSFALEMDIWIPDYLLRINRCILRVKPGKSRTASGVAVGGSSSATTTGASSASTTAAEGETPVNVESAGHVHLWATRLNTTASVIGTAVLTSPGPGSVNVPTVGDFDQYRTYDNTGGATKSVDLLTVGSFTALYTAVSDGGTVNVAPASHTHGMAHNHGMAHTHDTTITLSIAESGDAAGLHVYIDNVDRTTALGGPWDDAAVLDITQYLINVSSEPQAGAHPLKVTSTASGSVEVCLDFYTIVKPPLG